MSDVNTAMPTAEEMAEANDYLKWKEKDTLRTMTSKYNNAVSRFHERIEQLEDNAEKVNQGTQQQFDELDEALGQKFEQITQSLSKKIESVSAADVGLGECDNTSDMDKPVSTAQQQAIDAAIDKFASEFTEEIPDEDPIGDDPEVSGPVKQYIDERIQDAVAHTGIGIASDKVLGGIKASDEIEVDQVTGKATVKGYSDLKKEVSDVKESLNSNNQVTQKVSDNQGDMEELQTEDKTTLVGAINEVFQLGSERKAILVENLTAMGVTCSTEETWEILLAKVLAIMTGYDTSDATMVASNLLLNQIGYNSAGKIIGTMPDRSKTVENGGSGDEILSSLYPTQTLNHSTLTQYGNYGADGSVRKLLLLRAPKGYYDFHGRVYAEPNEVAKVIGLTADKIVSGNTILEIAGTAVENSMSFELICEDVTTFDTGSITRTWEQLESYDAIMWLSWSDRTHSFSDAYSPDNRTYLRVSELKLLLLDSSKDYYTLCHTSNGSTASICKIILEETGITISKLVAGSAYKLYGVKNGIFETVQ